METIIHTKYNRISRYGKRIAAIQQTYSAPIETVATYHFNGMFHTFLLKAGQAVQYKQTKNW